MTTETFDPEFAPATVNNSPDIRKKALELAVSSYQHLHLLGGASTRYFTQYPTTTEILTRAESFSRFLALGEAEEDSDDGHNAC